MSAVNLKDVTVLSNPAPFVDPFQFEISYECSTPLEDDLEWKLIYVGSAEDKIYDQVLESMLVGRVNVGNYRFVFQADPSKFKRKILLERSLFLPLRLPFLCHRRRLCRLLHRRGWCVRKRYYVNNDYEDEQLKAEPPQKVLLDKVQRSILADKPRVTKFPLNFCPEKNEDEEPQPELVAEASKKGDELLPNQSSVECS
ncbi:hypothetical protein SASPL_133193 [Salvia splendens]|uniref:Histone chaperone ASF1 n=1 Tax=Salvia splendens TaxID=180675 RepID=A0A8X8ZHU4_SALSN|nr:hypothetical protein SASPL_133193 [Salvia splendens]